MIHIRKNKSGQFYWLSVTKKANTFEEIGRGTEYHTRKEKCIKNFLCEAEIFATVKYFYVVDHTAKDKVYRYFSWNGANILYPMPGARREIDFVKKLKAPPASSMKKK